jgi:uncharacterized protein (TIGR03118 family)
MAPAANTAGGTRARLVTLMSPCFHNPFTTYRLNYKARLVSLRQRISIDVTKFNLTNQLLRALVLSSAFVGCLSANAYLVHNLVADQPGIADHTDPNLVNPWGNAFSATSPFWIGNNGSGTSTLYDGTGTPNAAIVVQIPSPSGVATGGAVSGVMVNATATAFLLAPGAQSQFAFCTEDGLIAGWNSGVDATHAKVLLDNSKNSANYKGCVIAIPAGGTPQMYVANFYSGKVEVYDQTMKPVAAPFANPAIPASFAPFNIVVIGGKVYVAYAMPDAEKHDDVAGPGNGYVAVYDLTGNLLGPTISGGNLNSPWGMAIAPATFGDFGGALLVGNFGDGRINAYNPATGALMGTLNDTHGNPLSIDGLWALNFGNNGKNIDPATLYFTAGPGDESHGLLGSIQAAPAFTSANLVNGASFTTSLAPNTWVSIVKGGGMSATTRGWLATDFIGNALPTQLNGVGVTVNGNPAAVSYVSPTQINFLLPPNLTAGAAQIQVTNNGLASATVAAAIASTAPGFFTLGTADAATGNSYIAAEHANGSIGGPPSLISGLTTTPYNAGETMVLYGTGLGATATLPAAGQLLTAAISLATAPTATVGGQPATVSYAGLVGPGLYQINVVLPAGTATGATGATAEVPVVITAGGVQSQAKAVVAVTAGQ